MSNGRPQPPKVQYPKNMEQTTFVEKGGVDAETTKWQLSPEEVITDFKHHLKGERWDKIDNEWVEEVDKMATDQGIQRIIWFVKNFLNKNVQLSWFSDDDIAGMMRYFKKEFARFLRRKRKDFDIDKSDLSPIHMGASQVVWSGLNRARLGGEKEFIKDTEKRTVRMNQGENDSSNNSFWSKISPF